MKNILKILSVGLLILTFPTTVLGASYESEEGQAMIGPPSSQAKDSSEPFSDSPAEENTSGIDWDAANTAASPASGSGDFTVVIDPGHQGPSVDMSAPEPMAPGSSETKAKATSGTQGNFSGVPEYEVNLQVSLLLQQELTERGYRVIMTRIDHETAISNKERAELASQQNADITVRIHANSSESSSAAGALTMAPTSANQYLSSDIIEKSNTLASCIISHYCAATGLGNQGIISSDNMTGTNWSTVPVAILEMGFMSNQNDDLYITNTANHPAMVAGIADGIDEYFSIVEPQSAARGQHLSQLTENLQAQYTSPMEKSGQSWAIAVMDPVTDDYSTIRANESMQAAGLIRTYIMGAVYEKLVYPAPDAEPSSDYQKTLKPLLQKMIASGDNDAANKLVSLLGSGDFKAGAAVVNQFCQNHGFTSTRLESPLTADSSEKNTTSASDCCRLLSEIYNQTLVNGNASSEMLSLLKQQDKKAVIPSALPAELETAGTSGAQTDSMENNMAVVLDSARPYVICVLSNNIKNSADAKETTKKLSSDVYQYMTSNVKTSDTPS